MLQRTVTDMATGAGLATTPIWLDHIAQGAELLMIAGGIAIMLGRGWLLWKEIQTRRNDNGNS